MSLAPALTVLENDRLIRLAATVPELAYSFRHGLIQDAAYTTLLRAQRQAWHLATAEVLETAYLASRDSGVGAGDTGALPPVLAHHFTQAGENSRALHYLLLSGDAAFNRYANVEAIDFYSRALDIAITPAASAGRDLVGHLFARLGLALELTSQFQAALENYHRQEALAQQLGDQSLELASLTARAKILSTANFVMDLEQATVLLERARRLAHTVGDRASEAKISWTLLLNNTMAGGDVAERIEHGERALQLALELGERELLAFIYNDLWFGYAGAGRWSEGLDSLAAGRKISREVGNLSILSENLTRTALSHMATGGYAAALADMEQAYVVGEAAQSTDFQSMARAFAGLIHLDRGNLDQAIPVAETAIALGENSANVTVLIGTRSELARAYLLLGDVDHALVLARQALQIATDHFALLTAWPQSVLIKLHIARDELAEAEAIHAAASDYRELQRRLSFMMPMWGNMGMANIELALARHQFDLAGAEAAELVQRLEDCGIRFLLPEARLHLGAALLARGRLAEAQTVLETARQEAEALGSRRLLWPIFEALAETAARDGAPNQAAAFRREAREIVDYIAAHAPTDRLRASFLATPRVRALLAAS